MSNQRVNVLARWRQNTQFENVILNKNIAIIPAHMTLTCPLTLTSEVHVTYSICRKLYLNHYSVPPLQAELRYDDSLIPLRVKMTILKNSQGKL